MIKLNRILISGVFCILLFNIQVFAQDTISLYNNAIPNSLSSANKESGSINEIIKVSRPTLTVFSPAETKKGMTAVIICPGGGYGSLVLAREGFDVAKKFTQNGVVAFVLKYRLPDKKTMKDPSIAPLQDLQQAIIQVHLLAAKYNIDTNKIGLMGFSAGGHLASTAGTHFNKLLVKNENGFSLRPTFMILVYPVISFQNRLVHEGSMHNLLGDNFSEAERKYYSNELQVTKQTPPSIMVHATDDKWVPAANSIKFYEALVSNGVSAELHVYSKGDHGFASYPTFEEWFGRCKLWMQLNQFIEK